jgi:SecD/SecF fusion protein
MTAWILTVPMFIAQAAADPTLADAATQPATTAAAAGITGFMKLLIAVAILAGSFGLGILLARAIRLPEFGFKLGLIMLSAIGSAAICYFGWPPKLGIDLSGGVVLVYEVESSAMQAGKLEDLAETITDRLNQDRKNKIESKVEGDTIEFQLPADTDEAAIKSQIERLRSDGLGLAFKDSRSKDGVTDLIYTPDGKFQRPDMNELIGAVNKRINPSGVKEVTVRRYGQESLEIIIPEVQQSEVEQIKDVIRRQGALEFRILANRFKPEHRTAIERALASPAPEVLSTSPDGGRGEVAKWVTLGDNVGDHDAIVRPKRDGSGNEVLVMVDPYNVKGDKLKRSSRGVDQAGGNAIHFVLRPDGARLFADLTERNKPDPATNRKQRLGIVLDNVLISAPTLNEQIREQGQITGIDDERELDTIVSVLNAGSLPTALNKTPIQEQRISAQLGADTIAQGSKAMFLSFAGVIVFMLVYYRFAGVVADSAVLLNLLMAVASMILIKAAFTLPGLAGLVLTVGMAVDANVLIYERMREELQRGASLRMAIRNGYLKAFSTIIDSHVTTIATGVVLFVIGTDQIKGFAVTLILGLLVSLYTSVYVSRVVFDIFEKKRWLTKLTMMQWFKKTNIDFIGLMKPAAILSVIVIAIGMVAVAVRGKELLDIDFTGGTAVTIEFRKDKAQDVGKVRAAVSELPDVTVSSVGSENLQFKIDTSEPKLENVREAVKKAFGDDLNTYSMSIKNLRPFDPTVQKPAASQPEIPASEPSSTTQPSESTTKLRSDETTESTKDETRSDAEGSDKGAESPVPNDDKAAPSSPASPDSDSAKDDQKKSAGLRRTGLGRPHDLALAALALAQPETTAKKSGTLEEPEKNANDPTAAESNSTSEPAESAAENAIATPAAVGTTADLNFSEQINYSTLHDRIRSELKAMNLLGTYFELTNPKFTPGSSLRFTDWTLSIMLPQEEAAKVLEAIQTKLAAEPVFPSASEIGGKVAGDTKWAAVYAILASLVIIVVYVWIRFQNVVFGFAAVLALVHDVLVALGFLALSYWMANNLGMEVLLVDPFKISLAVVAALLTIVGFSINDTIVIFDRIREIRGKNPVLTGAMINQAVNETLSRTFITSGTVFIATFILYVFGGAGIHPFAFAMLVGVISGTYSTIYIAAPLLLWMKAGTSGPEVPRANAKETIGSSR